MPKSRYEALYSLFEYLVNAFLFFLQIYFWFPQGKGAGGVGVGRGRVAALRAKVYISLHV